MMWRRSFITARSIAMKMATNVYVMLANRVSCSDYSGGTVLMSVRLCLFSRRSALCGDAGFSSALETYWHSGSGSIASSDVHRGRWKGCLWLNTERPSLLAIKTSFRCHPAKCS
jgi:hypothetical protein